MARFIQYLKLALRNIRGNLLRTILTCLIIAFGIMALVGIQTAIKSLGNSVKGVFNPLGANVITITNQNRSFNVENSGKKPNPRITAEEADDFKEKFTFPGSKVSSYVSYPGTVELKHQGEKTNPNFNIVGVDEHYLEIRGFEIEHGRYFTISELQSGTSVALIGADAVNDLFDKKAENAIDKSILIGNRRYRIIGVVKKDGQGFNSNGRLTFVPANNIDRFYSFLQNHVVRIGVSEPEDVNRAVAEATGTMRLARKLKTTEENDFDVRDPGSANNDLIDVLNKVSMGGLLIGIITLTGATIGLMNIMLVSVTERIREIGVSKAIGATVGNIRLQYFIEGITISVLGGLLGIIFGLLIGLIVAKLTKSVFTIPWNWVLWGLLICIIVGIISSVIPAYKASRLNPIEALRSE